jgi:hypothetical protein
MFRRILLWSLLGCKTWVAENFGGILDVSVAFIYFFTISKRHVVVS